MLEHIDFTFNGINSIDMGVQMVNPNGGLYEDIFLSNRNIIENRSPYSSVSNFIRVEREPLSFPVSFHLEKWQDRNNLRQIVNWFDTDEYVEMFFNDDPQRVFYVIVEGASSLLHNGAKQGYVTLTMKSLYPFALSRTESTMVNSVSTEDTNFYIANLGDALIRPRIKITKTVSDGDISIKNNETNETLIITNILNGEIVDIDCENEIIRSSLEQNSNRYLYNSHNEVWLDINNNVESIFTVRGDFTMNFEFNVVYKAETR